MVVHVRFKSLYISLPSSAKQQREMTKFCVFGETPTTVGNERCGIHRRKKDGGCTFYHKALRT